MAKLLFALITVLTLSACNVNNFKDIDEKSSIPMKVIRLQKDTTLVFDKCIVSSEDYNYILQKTSKEVIVDQQVHKTSTDGIAFWVGFFFGAVAIAIICSIIFD